MQYNNPWVEYWNKDNIWSRSAFWRRQMEVFVRLTADVMDYNANDKVLDFGCGSGNFAEITADKIGSILCADMSENYVSVCANKFSEVSNVSVVRVNPDLSDLTSLGSGFTKVICFSVMHYFPDLDYVARFIKDVQQIAVPGTKLLIGDIGNNNRTWIDNLRALTFTLREGMFVDALKLIARIWLVDPNYRKIKQGGDSYLSIPDTYLMELGAELGVKVINVETQLTVNANYKHVLIEY